MSPNCGPLAHSECSEVGPVCSSSLFHVGFLIGFIYEPDEAY